MTAPSTVMTQPNYNNDTHSDLIRRIIESRTAYERLCGLPPTCIYLNGPLLAALAERGLKEQVAGLKIIARYASPADPAICSRDEGLFR